MEYLFVLTLIALSVAVAFLITYSGNEDDQNDADDLKTKKKE